MNRKIGIFTGWNPGVKLGNEGIGRLLLYLIRGMIRNGDEVTILTPSWHKYEVLDLLREYRLENQCTVRRTRLLPPVMLCIYHGLHLFHRWRTERVELDSGAVKEAELEDLAWWETILYSGLATYSFLWFACEVFLLTLAGLAVLPFAAVYVILRGAGRLLGRYVRIPESFKHYFDFVPRNLRGDRWVRRIVESAHHYELRKMVRYVNHCRIDYWYVPSVFWPEAMKIRKRRVITAPDVVYAEFGVLYAFDEPICNNAMQIDSILRKTPKLLCYSRHVAERQLAELSNIPRRNIAVVPHGFMDLSEHLVKNFPAHEMLALYLRMHPENIPNYERVLDYNFRDGRFMLYSSQCRFHKNVDFLLRVLNLLLRREFVDVKLVLTCSAWNLIMPRIKELNLTDEVLILPQVPPQILAALNELARLHVNPSYFEGGFPFTFSEAYSVGTPSVMADMAVNREMVTDVVLAEKMLFDPYDPEDAVRKIKYALSHRDEMLAVEKPLFEQIRARSWDIVAEEYVRAMRFSHVANPKLRHRRKAWRPARNGGK